jgi:hypothetical protein
MLSQSCGGGWKEIMELEIISIIKFPAKNESLMGEYEELTKCGRRLDECEHDGELDVRLLQHAEHGAEHARGAAAHHQQAHHRVDGQRQRQRAPQRHLHARTAGTGSGERDSRYEEAGAME